MRNKIWPDRHASTVYQSLRQSQASLQGTCLRVVALTTLCRDGCLSRCISIGGLAHDDCRSSTCLGRPLVSAAPWHSMAAAVTAPSGNPSS